MTKEQAIKLLEEATAHLVLNRKDHLLILQALAVLKEEK
jgi:hypothetical protein